MIHRFEIKNPNPRRWYNTVLLSPWTGKVWCEILRDPESQWVAFQLPAEGEKPWPLPETIPGSVMSEYYGGADLEELPRDMIEYEWKILTDLHSSFDYDSLMPLPRGYSMTLTERIALLRPKVYDGSVSTEELRVAYKQLREDRFTAAKAASAKKAAAAGPDPNALLQRFKIAAAKTD